MKVHKRKVILSKFCSLYTNLKIINKIIKVLNLCLGCMYVYIRVRSVNHNSICTAACGFKTLLLRNYASD